MLKAKAPSGDSQVLDPTVLEKLRKLGGDSLISRMAHAFLGHALTQFATLERAVMERNAPVAEKAAHSLSSSAGNLGARLFRVLVREAEIRSAQSDWASLDTYFPELRRHFEDLVKAVRETQ